MKRTLSIILCIVMVMMLFAGCGGNTDNTTGGNKPNLDDHKHAFASEWSSDAENHWYAATCGCDMKANSGAHVDADKDGVCDICAYEDESHEHTFEETWKSDEQNHWHPSNCVHVGAVADKAPHVDEDNDGTCDICLYNGDHNHTFATEWTTDGTQHWHESTCGHSVVSDQGDHIDENLDGNCDICNWADETHTHEFSADWSTDVTYHWHAAICEHSGAFSDKGVHVDEDINGRCDGCDYMMCNHQDFDLDAICDICGHEDPDHVHEYASEYNSDQSGHWQIATCHPGAKPNVKEHVDINRDGNCDTCGFVLCAHQFDATWSNNETHHWKMVLCTCSIPRAEYGEHIDEDGINGCDICMYGFETASPFELVLDKHEVTFTTTGMITWQPVTIEIPKAGHYLLYSDNEQIRWSTDGVNLPTGYTLEFDAEEAGELQLYAYYFTFNYNAADPDVFPIRVTMMRIDDLKLHTDKGKAELPTNMVYKVLFEPFEVGTYTLHSSVDSLVMGTRPDNTMFTNSVDIEVTQEMVDSGELIELYVELRDLTKISFTFDWLLAEPFEQAIFEGQNNISVPAEGDDFKVVFTAPEDGSYKLEVTDSWLTFCEWGLGGHNAPVRIEKQEILTGPMKAGETFTTWIQPMYDYPSAANINDTLTVINIGTLLSSNGQTQTVDATAEGARYSFTASRTTYYNITITGGEIGITASGKTNWTTTFEVKVKAGSTYIFDIRGDGEAQITITPVDYSMDLKEGENKVNMVPGKEYELTMKGIDANANVKITWDHTAIALFVNGEQYQAGTTVALLHNTFTVMVRNNGNVDVTFTVEIISSGIPADTPTSGELNIGAQLTLLIKGQGEGATASFTAPEGGSFTLTAGSETSTIQVFIQDVDGTTELLFTGNDSYPFQLNAGEVITFWIHTADGVMSAVNLSVSIGGR